MAFPQGPWEIGAAHHDQRDLYTVSSSTDDDGYALGPPEHPDVGSFAYTRTREEVAEEGGAERAGQSDAARLYEREAWPWQNYAVDEVRHHHQTHAHGTKHGRGLLARLFGGAAPAPEWRISPARIRDEACRAIGRHPDIDASDIEVVVAETEITLEGTVPDRDSKARAEELVGQVTGVTAVHNHLEVRSGSDDDTTFTLPVRTFSFAFGL